MTLCMGIVVAIPGCNSATTSDRNRIKIVSSLPRTGSAKLQTDTMVNGTKLALDKQGTR